MATTTTYNGDAAQDTFLVGYEYLSESFVIVTVDSVLQVQVTDYVFSADELSIVFEAGSIPGVGVANVVIARVTSATPLVDFTKGGAINDENLDTATQQSIHIAEEDRDNFVDGAFVLDAGAWDADSKIIKNLADGIAATDAATKGQVDTIAGSATDAAASAAAALVSELAAAASAAAALVSELAAAASEAVASGAARNFHTTSGTVDAIVLTQIVSDQFSSFSDGDIVRFRPSGPNTSGSVTVNVNGFGVDSLNAADGGNLAIGALTADQDAEIRFDSGSDHWELLNPFGFGEELISTVVISDDATLDVVLPSDYDEFRVEIRGYVPATDNTELRLRCSDDDGSTFHSSASDYDTSLQTIDNTTTNAGATGAATVGLRLGNAGVENADFDIKILNPGDGTLPFNMYVDGTGLGASTHASHRGGSSMTATGSVLRIDQIQLFSTSGNMTSGTIKLYGRRTS